MASVANLLRDLGDPPREICLDWVGQLKQLQTGTDQPAPAPDEVCVPLTWQDLHISTDGHLELAPGAPPRFSTESLVQWLTLKSRSAADSQIQHSERAIVPSDRQCKAERIRPTFDSSQTTPRRSRRTGKVLPFRRTHIAATLVVGSVILGICWSFQSDGGTPRVDQAVVSPAARSRPNLAGAEPTVENTDGQPQMAMRTLASLTTASDLAATESEGDTNSTDGSGLASMTPSLVLPTITQTGQPQDQTNTPATGNGQAEPSAPAAEAIETSDVMQAVTDFSKAAQKSETETELADASPKEPANSIQEPLLLATWPMLQNQKLPSRISARPRHPVWHVALVVDEGFRVAPAEPQIIVDRRLASWVIVSDNAKSPMTQIVVQVQSRQASLRWQITASAEDWPQLAFPIDDKLLPQLQDRLRQFSQLAGHESERLKQLAPSAPRELRTGLTQRRAGLEQQVVLANRMLQSVSETLLFNDRLHGQITVHAQLFDGEGENATKILQYGEANPNAVQ